MLKLKNTLIHYKDVFLLGLIAAPIGIIIGALEALFGKGLSAIANIRSNLFFYLTPFLPLAGMLIAFAYSKIGKNSIKGMSLIFSASFDEEESIPKRLVPLLMVSTWLTHLFGGSAGREGAAVQIGGTVAHWIEKPLRKKLNIKNSAKFLLITGMAAGFAGMFQTPIAAIFFAMEVLTVGAVEYCALFPCIIASIAAYSTSQILGLEKFTANLGIPFELNIPLVLKIVLLGALCGIVGGAFAYTFKFSHKFFSDRIKNPILRIFIMGCILSVLFMLFHAGRYSGSGESLIEAAFSKEITYGYDWILKFLLTILTLSAGFQGGEVTPLFSIGATLGAYVAPLFGLPSELAAALAFVAVFGSATNTILAPIFIGGEIFGFEYLPYFFLVSAIAYVFNGNQSIYAAQRRLTGNQGRRHQMHHLNPHSERGVEVKGDKVAGSRCS